MLLLLLPCAFCADSRETYDDWEPLDFFNTRRQASLLIFEISQLSEEKKNSHKILTLVDSYDAEASIFDESISLVQASLSTKLLQTIAVEAG